jgi:hypothetical protein
MEMEILEAFVALTYREQWLTLKEIMKLHEMHALDCVEQPALVAVAVKCLPGPRYGRAASATINGAQVDA